MQNMHSPLTFKLLMVQGGPGAAVLNDSVRILC
jgi:hypothetical protein